MHHKEIGYGHLATGAEAEEWRRLYNRKDIIYYGYTVTVDLIIRAINRLNL